MHRTPSFRNHFYNKDAFSLVELMVVIGIIALLAGIIIPSVEVLREKGKETACANNMRQWGLAMPVYVDEHRAQFPRAGTGGDHVGAWYNVLPGLLPRYKGIDVASYASLRDTGKAPCPGMGKSPYICPSHPIDANLLSKYTEGSQRSYALSYAMNSNLSGALLSNVRRPEHLVLFFEANDANSSSVDADTVAFRHRGRTNILFVDGHVAPVLRAYVNDVQWDPHFEPGMAPASGPANGE